MGICVNKKNHVLTLLNKAPKFIRSLKTNPFASINFNLIFLNNNNMQNNYIRTLW